MIRKFRRTAQIASLVFMVLIPVLNSRGIAAIAGSFYSVAIGPVWITDPLIGAQTVLTTFSMDSTLLLSILIPILFALVLGRVFCSWICPQNTLSELVDAAANRLGLARRLTPRPSALPRRVVLIVILAATPLAGIPLASLLSAPGIISVQTAQLVRSGTVGIELALIAAIVVVELFAVRRGWCNYVCPVGSFLGLFRVPRTLKVVFSEKDGRQCGRCLACADACQLGLDPMQGRIYPQCHNCGACVSACENLQGEKRPLSFKF